MSDEEQKLPKAKMGCFGKLATLFAFGGLSALGAGLYFVAQPQPLDDLEGHGPGSEEKSSRDLLGVLQNSLKGGYPLSLSEEEVNLYLRDTLAAKQGGLLEGQVKFKEVLVRFEQDRAEVVMVREISGKPFTVSMFVQVLQTESPDGTIQTQISLNGGLFSEQLPRPNLGGRFGRVPVPEGFLHLILPSFRSLTAVYRDPESSKPRLEIDCIEEMARIRIEEGKLILDPRPNTREMPLPGGF